MLNEDDYTLLPNGLKCFGKIVTKYTTSTSAPDETYDANAGYDYGDEHVQTGANGAIVWKCNDPTAGAAEWEIFIGEGADATNLSQHGKVDEVGGIDIGEPVYISGVSGSIKAKFKKGDRTGHDPSHLAGLAKESKDNNQDIHAIRKGLLVGTTADPLNTSSFSDDPPERLHLGPNGTILGGNPGGGGSHVEIGRCLRSHITEGVIVIDIASYVHNIRAWSGGDIVLAGGDDAGANGVLFKDYTADATVGKVDTLGRALMASLATTAEIDNGDSGAADTITWSSGNIQKSTLTANCTYTFGAPLGAAHLTLKVIQGGVGSFTVTWPATVKWASGTAPTLTAAAGSVDVIDFRYDGTNYYGVSHLDMQ